LRSLLLLYLRFFKSEFLRVGIRVEGVRSFVLLAALVRERLEDLLERGLVY